MLVMKYIDFSGWIESELQKRGWQVSELARRADTYPATIARIINRERKPGPDVCQGIARAFGMPSEDVFRIAGLLPQLPDEDATLKHITTRLRGMMQNRQGQAVIPYIENIVDMFYKQTVGNHSLAEDKTTYTTKPTQE